MENVGAVTFTENYIPTGELTTLHLTRLQNTTLHELCHQWFGNLCTMEWWDDLWLNEAFATYMAYLCTSENDNLFKKTPGMWITLNQRKNMAINSDSLSTTHPIYKDAVTTDSADDMVNAITYGKGSSFIKQLIHLIGKEAMSKGCSLYFERHAWGNTKLGDFLDALVDGCEQTGQKPDVDLRQFCIDFLTHKGVNNISAKMQGEGDSFKIIFSQNQMQYSEKFHSQRLNYNLYDNDMNCETYSLTLTNNNQTQEVQFPGRTAENTLILLNSGDHAYITSELSPEFIQKLSEGNLHKITDSLDRTVVWRTLLFMVKRMTLKSTDFFNIAIKNIFDEQEIVLLDIILSNLKVVISLYIPEENYFVLCKQMFENLYTKYLSIPDENKELKDVLRSGLIAFVADTKNIETSIKFVKDKLIPLEVDEKKDIVRKVFEAGTLPLKEAQAFLEEVLGDDKSDRATRFRLTIDACIPDKVNKAKIWEIITHPKENGLSMYEYGAYLSGFYSRYQKDITQEYVAKYLENVPKFATDGEKDHMSIFTRGAAPPSYFVTEDFLSKVNVIIKDFETKDKVKYDSFLRTIKSYSESTESNIKIREFAKN
jgi:aminopeptidase N